MNILDLREYRDNEEFHLSKNYNLITIRPNFPGSDKRNIYSNFVSLIGLVEILKDIDAKEVYSSYSEEGLIFYIQSNEDVYKLKKAAITFERWFQIGRLLDIDIRNRDGEISRSNLNYAKRKCFLCNNKAHICVRNRKHSFNDIESFFRKEVIKYLYEGDRKTVFTKFLIFSSSVEFYKRLIYVKEDYWKIDKDLIERNYINKILEIINILNNNTLDLTDDKNFDLVFEKLEKLLDDITFMEKDHIYMLIHLYSNYINNTNISFKVLFNNAIDISNIIIISESIKERTNIKNGLFSLVDIIIKDRKKLDLIDEECANLKLWKKEKNIEEIRKFVYRRNSLFYYTYTLSIFSLILLLMENTKKEVYAFEYL